MTVRKHTKVSEWPVLFLVRNVSDDIGWVFTSSNVYALTLECAAGEIVVTFANASSLNLDEKASNSPSH